MENTALLDLSGVTAVNNSTFPVLEVLAPQHTPNLTVMLAGKACGGMGARMCERVGRETIADDPITRDSSAHEHHGPVEIGKRKRVQSVQGSDIVLLVGHGGSGRPVVTGMGLVEGGQGV